MIDGRSFFTSMELFPVMLLALAVSIDSFSVGLTYGFRKVRIPFHAILIIALCSGSALFLASLIGKYIGEVLSPEISDSIGGGILIVLGVWAVIQFFRSAGRTQDIDEKKVWVQDKTLVKFELKTLGIVIHILKKPMSADLDKSGTITGWEAVLLGTALSLDAMGAGVGASMLGFPPIYLAIMVGIMSSLFAGIGIKFGASLSRVVWLQRFSFIPGLLLICIGLWKI